MDETAADLSQDMRIATLKKEIGVLRDQVSTLQSSAKVTNSMLQDATDELAGIKTYLVEHFGYGVTTWSR